MYYADCGSLPASERQYPILGLNLLRLLAQGGAVPLWGGEVAKSFKDINQGGSLWVFKLAK